MIPIAQITQWRTKAPWTDDLQVEQDLILSRIMVEIFSDPFLNKGGNWLLGVAQHFINYFFHLPHVTVKILIL